VLPDEEITEEVGRLRGEVEVRNYLNLHLNVSQTSRTRPGVPIFVDKAYSLNDGLFRLNSNVN